jgi:uncharacterized membrane protein YfcA
MAPSHLARALDWAYDRAIEGLPGLDSAYALAAARVVAEDDPGARVERLIHQQLARAGTVGFLAGATGAISLPVAVPANVAALLFVQIRLVAAIAALGGHDLGDPRVRRLVYLCLTADAAPALLTDAGVVVGRRLTREVLAAVPGRMLATIDRRVARRLATAQPAGEARRRGSRLLPLVGGLVGAATDALATQRVARAARAVFMPPAAVRARPGMPGRKVARATNRGVR